MAKTKRLDWRRHVASKDGSVICWSADVETGGWVNPGWWKGLVTPVTPTMTLVSVWRGDEVVERDRARSVLAGKRWVARAIGRLTRTE